MKIRQSWKTIFSTSSQDESSASHFRLRVSFQRTHTHTHSHVTRVHEGDSCNEGVETSPERSPGQRRGFRDSGRQRGYEAHTPPGLPRREKKKKGGSLTRERERRSWKPEDSVIDALTRTSTTIFFPRETSLDKLLSNTMINYYYFVERMCVKDEIL